MPIPACESMPIPRGEGACEQEASSLVEHVDPSFHIRTQVEQEQTEAAEDMQVHTAGEDMAATQSLA